MVVLIKLFSDLSGILLEGILNKGWLLIQEIKYMAN